MQYTPTRRRLPHSRYATVSPETWTLIRGAYLSGLSAPTVAARFGISETALRRRAGREGWTKAAFAARATPWPGAAPRPSIGPGPDPQAGSPASAEAAAEEAVLAYWRAPLHVRPGDLARKALAQAVSALKSGQGLAAQRLARAAAEIARLDAMLDFAEEDVARSDERNEAQAEMMRLFIRERVLGLAQDLAAGRDLPPEYEALKLDLARRQALCDAADAAGADVSGVSG